MTPVADAATASASMQTAHRPAGGPDRPTRPTGGSDQGHPDRSYPLPFARPTFLHNSQQQHSAHFLPRQSTPFSPARERFGLNRTLARRTKRAIPFR